MFSSNALPSHRVLKSTAVLLLASLISSAKAQEIDHRQTVEATAPVIEEVLVTGRRPGPPLWRVTHGDNTLWVFATLSPLPEQLRWDNSAIEFLLSEADAFIEAPDVSASTSNPLKAIRTIRKLNALEKLPKGVTLAQVTPADLFDNFNAIRSRFAPRARGIERLRPMPATEKLLKRVYKNAGLTNEDRIYPKLLKMAKRQKLEIYPSTTEIALGDAVDVFSTITLASEIECMREGLQTIAVDLHASIERANAWAEGDAHALLHLDYPDANGVCRLAISETEIAREAMRSSDDLWLANAERALGTHKTTVTSLPIAEIARQDGLLGRLRAAGYHVRGQSI